ncbi:MAG: hypothetical protein IH888_10730 [Planctomycetes bacterium]|nr:hypothetical protein [Planctomycetota bacterium]
MARILTLMAVAAIFSFGALGCGKSDPVTMSDSGDMAKPDHPKGEDPAPKGEEHPKGDDAKTEHPKGDDAKTEHPKGDDAKTEHPKGDDAKTEHPNAEGS